MAKKANARKHSGLSAAGRFTPGELKWLGSCTAVVGVVTFYIRGFYRFVLKRVCEMLEIG